MASWRTLEVTGRVSGGSCRHARTLEWVIDSQKGRGAAWKDSRAPTRSPGSVPMAPAGFGIKRGPLGGPWSTLESSVAPREGSKLKEVSPGGL